MLTIDLNSDLGEGFGTYKCGDDDGMLRIITSANVACGFHAGDPETIAATFSLAAQRGVAIGAHPGFPDLWGFGRRHIPFTPAEIERLVAYQVGAALGVAGLGGQRLAYVKPHGALANIACAERPVADAIARGVRAVDPTLGLLCIALSEQGRAGEAAGLRVYQEIFADRGYDENGRLIQRGLPDAMITDASEAADRILKMVTKGAILTAEGSWIATPIHSICVHGDSAHAIETATLVRQRLTEANVTLRSFT